MWKVLDKLGELFLNFFTALKYAVFDYDAKMQVTKTPKQRMLIWTAVGVLTFIAVFSALLILGSFIRPLINKQ